MDPGDRSAAQQAGGADVEVGVEDAFNVVDQPLVVVVHLIAGAEDAEDGAGVGPHDRLAGRVGEG